MASADRRRRITEQIQKSLEEGLPEVAFALCSSFITAPLLDPEAQADKYASFSPAESANWLRASLQAVDTRIRVIREALDENYPSP